MTTGRINQIAFLLYEPASLEVVSCSIAKDPVRQSVNQLAPFDQSPNKSPFEQTRETNKDAVRYLRTLGVVSQK